MESVQEPDRIGSTVRDAHARYWVKRPGGWSPEHDPHLPIPWSVLTGESTIQPITVDHECLVIQAANWGERPPPPLDPELLIDAVLERLDIAKETQELGHYGMHRAERDIRSLTEALRQSLR